MRNLVKKKAFQMTYFCKAKKCENRNDYLIITKLLKTFPISKIKKQWSAQSTGYLIKTQCQFVTTISPL